MSGKKYVVLTATRPLQDQYMDDGFIDGVVTVDVRGRANYECRETRPLSLNEKLTCEEGADEGECAFLGKPGCRYYDTVEAAKGARGIDTNYSYWIHARSKNKAALEKKKEPIGLLICDEAHLAMNQLASFLRAWVGFEDANRYVHKELSALIRAAKGEEWGRVTGAWVDAIELLILGIAAEQYRISGNYEFNATEAYKRDGEYRRLDKVRSDLEKVAEHGRDNNWIWQETKNGVKFNCVWPGKYAERYLWSGVESVVLMSGTLRPKALHMLNIRATDYYFKEWPRQFPEHLTPTYWLKTGKMGRNAGQEELEKAVKVGDQIFKEWGHLKGLAHTASYTRARWLESRCSWGRHMFINERGEASQNAQKFRKAKAPAVLVSPSYTVGIDLANEQCDWIWIPKLPFPDRSDPVIIARCQDDEDYYNYETAQTLVQSSLRGSRHEKDRCTVIITDDAVNGFRKYARRHMPSWYGVKDIDHVPKAPRT
jgi:Rad3-related DNA helicase